MSRTHEEWTSRIREAFGLSLLDHPARLRDGLRAALADVGIPEDELFTRLERRDAVVKTALARALTVGETYFFREPQYLDLVRDQLLPAALERGPVTLVSAACASGEEAYSLAIGARQRLGTQATGRVKVLAFDLNAHAIQVARRGVYRPWSLRGMSEDVKRRWFDEVADGASVKAEVRSLVSFEQRNMVDPGEALPAASVDIILCRNVLIYFDDATVKLTLALLTQALRPGGTLIVGQAESAFLGIAGLGAHAVGDAWIHTRGETLSRESTPIASPRLGRAPVRRPPPSSRRPRPKSTPRPPITPPRPVAPRVRQPETADVVDCLDRGWAALSVDPRAASEEARRAILLDRTLAAAHVLAASAAFAQLDSSAARRSLRNARRYLSSVPPAEILRGGGGATAGELASYCARLERALDERSR